MIIVTYFRDNFSDITEHCVLRWSIAKKVETHDVISEFIQFTKLLNSSEVKIILKLL